MSRGHRYQDPAAEGWCKLRLERANDAMHDLEVRINTRTNRAVVVLDDGILRAVSVFCDPATVRVERSFVSYCLYAGDAILDVTQEAAVKLRDWLVGVLPAPASPATAGASA